MVNLLRMYAGLRAKLLTEMRADGVKAGSFLSEASVLAEALSDVSAGWFWIFFFFGFYLLRVQPTVVPHV